MQKEGRELVRSVLSLISNRKISILHVKVNIKEISLTIEVKLVELEGKSYWSEQYVAMVSPTYLWDQSRESASIRINQSVQTHSSSACDAINIPRLNVYRTGTFKDNYRRSGLCKLNKLLCLKDTKNFESRQDPPMPYKT